MKPGVSFTVDSDDPKDVQTSDRLRCMIKAPSGQQMAFSFDGNREFVVVRFAKDDELQHTSYLTYEEFVAMVMKGCYA